MGQSPSKEPVDNLRWALTAEVALEERLNHLPAGSENEILRKKGRFLSNLYFKLSRSSVHLLKLQCRVKLLKSMKLEHPRDQMIRDAECKKLENEVARGLEQWNNARFAADWLERDHELGSKAVEWSQTPSDNPIRKDVWGHLEAETDRLKREALVVGLKYLDSNHSGFLEPSDVPYLPVTTFARLDTSRKHRISGPELTRAMSGLEKTVKGLQAQLSDLERDLLTKRMSATPGVAQERAEVEKEGKHRAFERVLQTMKQEEQLRNDIVALFHQAFTRSVFEKLGPNLQTDVQPFPAEEVGSWTHHIGVDILQNKGKAGPEADTSESEQRNEVVNPPEKQELRDGPESQRTGGDVQEAPKPPEKESREESREEASANL